MDAAIAELIRALLAHSECIALFILLIVQQLIMHQVNVRKLTSLRNLLRHVQAELATHEKKDAPPGQ